MSNQNENFDALVKSLVDRALVAAKNLPATKLRPTAASKPSAGKTGRDEYDAVTLLSAALAKVRAELVR